MAENTNCSLKLFVNKNSHQVLFAEAGKEFVDLLFALLSVPIGTIMRLGGKDAMSGSCLGSVYDSLEDFSTTNLLPIYQNNKESILTPESFLKQALDGGGYVKGNVMYMVLDDLTVKPMNTMSIIDIVSKLKIGDVSNVEELVVDVGKREFPKLLCASSRSKTILTDVFLNDDNHSEEHMSEAEEEEDAELLCSSCRSKTILTDMFLNDDNHSEEHMSEAEDEEEEEEEE